MLKNQVLIYFTHLDYVWVMSHIIIVNTLFRGPTSTFFQEIDKRLIKLWRVKPSGFALGASSTSGAINHFDSLSEARASSALDSSIDRCLTNSSLAEDFPNL